MPLIHLKTRKIYIIIRSEILYEYAREKCAKNRFSFEKFFFLLTNENR